MNKILSTKAFIISHLLLLLISLAILGGLYFILNQNYQTIDLSKYNPVTKRPTSFDLQIKNPENDLLTFEKIVTVSGKTSPNITVIIVNNDRADGIKSDGQGNFVKTVDLAPGLNQIQIASFDKEGKEKIETRTVYYSEEKL